MTYLVCAEDAPTVTITSDWNGSSSLGNEHAYLLSFGDSSSHEYDVSVEHLRGSTDLLPSIQTTFLEGTATLTARVVLDTAVAWNDTISIEVVINSHNGVVLPSPVVVERTFTVGSWNQPMADHEVTPQQLGRLNKPTKQTKEINRLCSCSKETAGSNA